MTKRRRLTIIGIIAGSLAILMMFVFPFFIPENWDNFAWVYFLAFLLFIGIGNVTMEKSQKPLTLKETRKEKIKEIGL